MLHGCWWELLLLLLMFVVVGVFRKVLAGTYRTLPPEQWMAVHPSCQRSHRFHLTHQNKIF